MTVNGPESTVGVAVADVPWSGSCKRESSESNMVITVRKLNDEKLMNSHVEGPKASGHLTVHIFLKLCLI